MKIAIDISSVVYGTGVSTYTEELVRHLLKIDKTNEYILFGGSLRRKTDLQKFVDKLKGPSSRLHSIPPNLADLLWNRLHVYPIENLVGKVDVFHSSDWTQPPSSAYKVTTIHDLTHIKFPKLVHPNIRAVHNRRLKWIKKEVAKIIVPSETTKQDLLDLGYKPKRIIVVPEGVDGSVKRVSKLEITKVKKKYGIKGKYLLGVGVSPRKNTKKIINAYRKLQRDGAYKGLSLATKLKLVLVGHPYDNINSSDGVHLTGYVTDDDYSGLLAGAEALVFPSLYEGFGIPILDAFKMEIPVVTSNLGSMKEVAGDAAVLVDPKSVKSISEGINTALAQKESLIKKGLRRVKHFSWQKAAKETLKVYTRAA